MAHVFSLVFNKILKLLTHMTFYSVSAVIGYAAWYKRLKKYNNNNNNKHTFVQCFNSGPASQTVARYQTNIVYLVWTVETFEMLQLK